MNLLMLWILAIGQCLQLEEIPINSNSECTIVIFSFSCVMYCIYAWFLDRQVFLSYIFLILFSPVALFMSSYQLVWGLIRLIFPMYDLHLIICDSICYLLILLFSFQFCDCFFYISYPRSASYPFISLPLSRRYA